MNKPATQQCGRAVFSDVHLSGFSHAEPFPQECEELGSSYSTNEQALEFLFFDLGSCVQNDSEEVAAPPGTN